jgi:hypothetical protein
MPALGCICPPEGCGSAASPNASKAGSLAAVGIVWNGEGVGETAKGWSDCDKKPNCKVALAPAPGAGKDGTSALKFHGEGAGWLGGGWNWFGWYPANGGVDISGYKNLTFWLRIDASGETAPELSAITVSLRCSNGGKDSASAALDRYAKEARDGKWHKVSIPIDLLRRGPGKQYDPTTTWEFVIGEWSATPRKFDIYIDDIGFEK